MQLPVPKLESQARKQPKCLMRGKGPGSSGTQAIVYRDFLIRHYASHMFRNPQPSTSEFHPCNPHTQKAVHPLMTRWETETRDPWSSPGYSY